MNKDNIKKDKTSKLDKYILAILAIIILDLELFGIFGIVNPFRDYVIIFEGGYRVLLGQIQYLDFYFPTGPMVFFVQAFFQFIFGSNILAMAAQSFFLAIILCSLFYFIVKNDFGWILSFIFALFFYFSFNGLTFQPWYDHLAYFFFFLNIFLLMKYYKRISLPREVYFLSALLVTLSFYSKQDVGLLQVVFLLIYFLLNYSKEYKLIIKYYLISLILMIGGIYFVFNIFTDISYWFNLGQYPHSPRISHFFITIKLFNIITSWKLYISLFLIYKVLLNKIFNRNFNSTKLMCLFIIVAITPLITQVTSRSYIQTLVTGIPLLLFILYLLIKDNIKKLTNKYKFVFGLIIIILLLLTINPFQIYGRTMLDYVDSDLGRIEEGCYSGAILTNSALEGLNTIRKTIEENENDFISFTEYQFLYCDYNVTPPKNFPLNFDEGVIFFKQDVSGILDVVNSSSPKVILLQDPHVNENPNLNNEFEELFYEWGYIKIEIVKAMAESDISIFVKQ